MSVRWFRNLIVALALLGAAGWAHALEQKSLLATDGTLYTVRAGTAEELGIVSADVIASQYAMAWSAVHQDGSKSGAIIPGSVGTSIKSNLDLAYDDPSGSLVLLWKEEITII